MRVLVISDTHGDFSATQKLKRLHEVHPFDEVWHLGDFVKDAEFISKMLEIPSVAVKGNCDVSATGEEEITLIRAGYRIYLTHGHLYGVKSSVTRLFYKALESDYDLVCFGHTHVPFLQKEGQSTLFNPGSLSRPHLGQVSTYGIISLTPCDMVAEIIEL